MSAALTPRQLEAQLTAVLQHGRAVQGTLGPGDSALFRVFADRGQIVVVTARHGWFAATMTVRRPDGVEASRGDNTAVILGDPPGEYRVVLRPPANAVPGPYSIQIRDLVGPADLELRSAELTAWNEATGFSLRTIDPADDDFSDLEPLVSKIGSSRIVMLGEQTHNDGATFLAKARLVRFLHSSLGFDVLAWEGGFVEVDRFDVELRSSLPLDSLPRRLSRNWWASSQVRPVFDYARTTYAGGKPLAMAGLDPQFVIAGSDSEYVSAALEFFDRADAGFISPGERSAFSEAVRSVMSALNGARFRATARDSLRAAPRSSAPVIAKLIARVQRRRGLYTEVHGRETVAFHLQALRNVLALEREVDAMVASDGFSSPSSNSVRDRMMAANLAWLATKRYPRSRVVVWAASFHIIRNAATVDAGFQDVTTLGMELDRLMPGAAFSIAFTTFDGHTGSPTSGQQWEVPPAPPASLESFLHASGAPYVFVDLRTVRRRGPKWMRGGFLARPNGNLPLWNDWTGAYDAFVFLDRMLPSTR